MFLTKALLSSVIIPLSLVTGLSISPTVTSNDDSIIITENVTISEMSQSPYSWTESDGVGDFDTTLYRIVYKHSIYISFNDNHKHTGRITYQQSVSGRQPYIEDSENVIIRGNYIYFYDVMGIRIDYFEQRGGTGSTPPSYTSGYVNVTVSNLLNTTVDKDINDVYSVINALSGTVTDIKTDTSTIIDKLQALIDGTSSSQDAADDLEDKASDLADNIGSLDDIESDAVGDMTAALTEINPSQSGIVQNGAFVNASKWVVQQFNWIVNMTPVDSTYRPFSLLLIYSLTLGLALYIIGKMK